MYIYILSALEDIILTISNTVPEILEALLILRTGTWNLNKVQTWLPFSLFFSLNPLHSFHWSFLLIIQNVSSDGFWILYLTTLIAGKKLYHILLDHVKSNNPRLQTFFFTTFDLVIFPINQSTEGRSWNQAGPCGSLPDTNPFHIPVSCL